MVRILFAMLERHFLLTLWEGEAISSCQVEPFYPKRSRFYLCSAPKGVAIVVRQSSEETGSHSNQLSFSSFQTKPCPLSSIKVDIAFRISTRKYAHLKAPGGRMFLGNIDLCILFSSSKTQLIIFLEYESS